MCSGLTDLFLYTVSILPSGPFIKHILGNGTAVNLIGFTASPSSTNIHPVPTAKSIKDSCIS